MIDKKKAFENSFKGYHKDAPKFLASKSKALHKAKKDKFSKAVGKMVNRLDWEHKDTLS